MINTRRIEYCELTLESNDQAQLRRQKNSPSGCRHFRRQVQHLVRQLIVFLRQP